MFSDVISCATMLKLFFYVDLMYHALLGHVKVCLSCAMTACKCDNVTHTMKTRLGHDDVMPTSCQYKVNHDDVVFKQCEHQ